MDRMSSIQKVNKSLRREIRHLKEKIVKLLEVEGVVLDEGTSADLHQIMMENDEKVLSSPESFQRLFWDQQKEALKSKANGRRWHHL
jgi:hypothetical protein